MENKLWFRAKRFGWGWTPVTWPGWGVLLLYVFAILSESNYVKNHESSGSDFVQQFIPQLIVLTTFLIIICYKTGEKPAWRWGSKDADQK